MKKGMRRFGWIGVFLLGIAIGAVSYRALRPTERTLVLIYAPKGARECKMKFSVEIQEAWNKFPVIADGGGVLACDQRREVDPGLWVDCMCLETGGDGS